MRKAFLTLLADALAAVMLCASLVGYEYYGPGKTAWAGDAPMMETTVRQEETGWREKFADRFTDTVVTTDTSYTSPNLAIEIRRGSFDTGREDGNQREYGTQVSYVLADIYMADITCFQTAFAGDSYSGGSQETPTDMAARTGAVLAVNGDSYSDNQQENNGIVVRNGIIYRCNPSDAETCVLNWDGTMVIYPPGEISTDTLAQAGAYQSWVFGPSLLDEEGRAKTDFIANGYLFRSHPRTAIGYYEPGHYCLLAVDGRQENARGMFLDEMADLFEELGCRAAYNLDGGHSSCMEMEGAILNHLYDREYEVPDTILILEGRA